MSLSKKDKGVVIRYLIKMTGYSRQQLTRLIQKYTKTGKINWTPCRSNGFSKKYTHQDIALLAKTDELHDTPCGQAVKKTCEHAFDVFNDQNYEWLSEPSISYLYNLIPMAIEVDVAIILAVFSKSMKLHDFRYEGGAP